MTTNQLNLGGDGMGRTNIDNLPFSEHIKEKLRVLVWYALEKTELIDKIILFGSYARGEYKINSDLDILFLTTKNISRDVKGDIASFFDENNADAVFFLEEQFKNSECILSKQIRKDGVLLWRK